LKNAKNYCIEAKMHKLTESVIPHQTLFQHQLGYNENRVIKPKTKINPNAQEKHPASMNLLNPLRRFCNVILQHQVLPRLGMIPESCKTVLATCPASFQV